VRWPGKIKAGSVSDTPVIGSDIFPTICETLGIPLPHDRTIDGTSLLPLFAGQPLQRNQPLYWRNHLAPTQYRVGMRIGDWKIIGSDDLASFELYNIQADWQETKNVAEQFPDTFADMRAKLIRHDKDVLAEGPDWWKLDTPRKRGGSKSSEPPAGTDSTGDFNVVLGADVSASEFGYSMSPESEGLAFQKLKTPITGVATIRLKYRSQQKSGATRNGAWRQTQPTPTVSRSAQPLACNSTLHSRAVGATLVRRP
jgi:hypothetical protein